MSENCRVFYLLLLLVVVTSQALYITCVMLVEFRICGFRMLFILLTLRTNMCCITNFTYV